jgi:hypothetical protein
LIAPVIRSIVCNKKPSRNIDLKPVARLGHIQNNGEVFLYLVFLMLEAYKKDQIRHHNQQGRERLSK